MSKVSAFDGSKPCHFGCWRDLSKCMRLLGELSFLSLDVTAVQETYFICAMDCRVLENDYVVLSAYGSRSSVGISLLIGRSLNADVNLVLADDEGLLIVADVAILFRISSGRGLCALYRCREGFLLFGG